MREFLKIVSYIFGVLLGGALLAPPLWWLGQWAIRTGLLSQLRPFSFDKYFNRAALIFALGFLPVLIRSLQIHDRQALGLADNPRRFRDVCLGLSVAVGGFALTAVSLFMTNTLCLAPHASARSWTLALVAAAVVGCLEEVLFRGVFLGVLRRHLHPNLALVASSALFASLHFLRPNPHLPAISDVGLLSGLQLLPYLFWEYAKPARLWASWATLAVMAWVLGGTVIKTRSLYMAIGMHAGWVFGVKALSLMAKPPDSAAFWLGNDWRSGAAPLCLMVATGFLVRTLLHRRLGPNDPKRTQFYPDAALARGDSNPCGPGATSFVHKERAL